MTQDITDDSDLILKIGSSQAGGPNGILIIDDFEWGLTKNKETKHGACNTKPQGRTSGNQELDVSFTHIGQNEDLINDVENGNFSVVLQGNLYQYELDYVDGDFTVNISDGGDYELDFDGDALAWERNSV